MTGHHYKLTRHWSDSYPSILHALPRLNFGKAQGSCTDRLSVRCSGVLSTWKLPIMTAAAVYHSHVMSCLQFSGPNQGNLSPTAPLANSVTRRARVNQVKHLKRALHCIHHSPAVCVEALRGTAGRSAPDTTTARFSDDCRRHKRAFVVTRRYGAQMKKCLRPASDLAPTQRQTWTCHSHGLSI
jgi:hypothetical protein